MSVPVSTGEGARLRAVLNLRNEDGTHRYSREDVLAVYPIILLQLAATAGEDALTREDTEILAAFATQAGVTRDATGTQLQAAIAAHYAAHPINPELLAALTRFVREELAGSAETLGRSFSRFSGARAMDAPPPPLSKEAAAAKGLVLPPQKLRG